MVALVKLTLPWACLIAAVSALPLSLQKRRLDGIQSYCQPGYFALTFDDGPYKYTNELIHKLNEHGVKATFFINGGNFWDINNNTEAQNVIKNMYTSGHQVASHTFTHSDLNKLSNDEIKSEMAAVDDALMRIIGVRPAFIRPPYGNANKRVANLLNSLGYTVVTWSIDSMDYVTHNLDKEMTHYRNELGSSHGPNGAIALEHDVYEQTVTQLANAAIEYVKREGFKFATVAECFNEAPYH